MNRNVRRIVLPLAMALITGCTTTGSGAGFTSTDRAPVAFNWRSNDSVSGTLTAALPDGKTFSGRYFQITSETTVDRLGPLWYGGPWGWRGRGWSYWEPSPAFVKHYSGKVVANLTAPDGERMRCHFHLIRPSSGMSGGGQGKCQLPNGQNIDAMFPGA